MTRKNGLTLLELIVVVIIIAIGASLALPNFRKGADQKRADSAIAGLRAMSYCLRIYVRARRCPSRRNEVGPSRLGRGDRGGNHRERLLRPRPVRKDLYLPREERGYFI